MINSIDLPMLTEFKVGKNVFSQLYYFTMQSSNGFFHVIKTYLI